MKRMKETKRLNQRLEELSHKLNRVQEVGVEEEVEMLMEHFCHYAMPLFHLEKIHFP